MILILFWSTFTFTYAVKREQGSIKRSLDLQCTIKKYNNVYFWDQIFLGVQLDKVY